MFLSNIHDAQDGYKPAIVHGFDKIVFRIHQADLPTPEFSKFARLHCARYGRVRRSRHLCVLRIVAPDQELIKAISVLPWKIVEAEVCRNTLVQDVFEARRRHDQLDRSFIQSNNRYGLRIAVGRDGGHSSYTSPRRPGLRFGWYSDRLCKFTRLPCLHEEAKAVGPRAVKAIGIKSSADMPTFPHKEFWQEHDETYSLDFEELGRSHLNWLEGRKRQTPRIYKTRSGFEYHVDRRVGQIIYQACSWHPEPKEPIQSLSWLVINYGRGPFLKRTVSLDKTRHANECDQFPQ